MPRHAQPRYRADRRCWIAGIGGRQVVLARDDDYPSPAKAKRAAEAEFHRLMAQEAARGGGPRVCPPLALVAAQYLRDLAARRDRGEIGQRTFSDYDGRIRAFVVRYGKLPADQIGADEIDAFLAEQTTWGMNRRVDFVRVLGTVYRWAQRRKLIACPPPTPPRTLPRKLKRDKIPTWAEVQSILAAIQSPGFRDFASFVAWTGCRPSEAASIEAKHLDDGAVTLTEHKTRRKTGASRVIILPRPAREIAERRAGERPTGLLFTNERGNPWNRYGWRLAFDRARAKAGADPRITLYTFRHARATELLLRTKDLSGVASILGNDPTVTARTYSDVVNQREYLRKLAEHGTNDDENPQAP